MLLITCCGFGSSYLGTVRAVAPTWGQLGRWLLPGDRFGSEAPTWGQFGPWLVPGDSWGRGSYLGTVGDVAALLPSGQLIKESWLVAEHAVALTSYQNKMSFSATG
jgi:hypothetical protein